MPLLDLAQSRTIRLKDRKRTFLIHTRRVLKADWLAYFAALVISSERHGGRSVTTVDVETPRLVLADRVITGAEGYKVAGDGKLEDLPNWQTRLPLAHRRQVALTLADVSLSTSESEFFIHPEGEEILLDATWSAGDAGMQRFCGLKHIFKTPTAAQHKRYNDASSRSVVVGGSRSGRTVYPNVASLLMELYDELIVAVDGYAEFELPLEPGRIAAEMDGFHKVTAAQELFSPSVPVETGTEGEEGEAETAAG